MHVCDVGSQLMFLTGQAHRHYTQHQHNCILSQVKQSVFNSILCQESIYFSALGGADYCLNTDVWQATADCYCSWTSNWGTNYLDLINQSVVNVIFS